LSRVAKNACLKARRSTEARNPEISCGVASLGDQDDIPVDYRLETGAGCVQACAGRDVATQQKLPEFLAGGRVVAIRQP
jgi:hypothetical protein